MTLVKFNNNLMDSPFYNLAKRFFDNDFDYLPTYEGRRNSGLSNIKETENEYVVELTAPGLKKEDVKIEIENDVLKISSDIEDSKEENNNGYYRKEFYKSSFQRNFTLPENVKKEEISASMTDGILNVVIPKIKEEEKKPENIQITIK